MTIETAEFVYIIAMPSTGKTFNGDYLELCHGYHHVDGDLPLRTFDKPESREAVKAWIKGSKFHPELKEGKSSDDLVGKEKYWTPVKDLTLNAAIRAAKEEGHEKIVITFAEGMNICRKYLMDGLKKAGATNVKLLVLTISEEQKLDDLYYRQKRQAEAMGITLGDFMRMNEEHPWEGIGDPTKEEFVPLIKHNKMLFSSFEDPPSDAIIIDVSSRDVHAMNKVDDALGLSRCEKTHGTYEEIVKKVCQRDLRRDEETPYTWHLWPELEKEVEEALKAAKTEEEKKSIQRRASSLVSLEIKAGRLSLLDAAVNAIAAEEEKEDGVAGTSDTMMSSVKRRSRKSRSSFISTGKVVVE